MHIVHGGFYVKQSPLPKRGDCFTSTYDYPWSHKFYECFTL